MPATQASPNVAESASVATEPATNVSEPTPPATVPQPAASVAPAPATQSPTPVAADVPPQQQTTAGSKRTGLIITLAVIVFAALVAVAYYAYNKTK